MEGGFHARYASTGHLVFAREGRLLATPFDLRRLQITGAPVPVVEDVMQSTASGVAHFSLSNLGSLVYVPGVRERTLTWVDRQGQEEPLVVEPHVYDWARISPDGRHLAVHTTEAGNTDVRIYNLERDTLTRLTFDAAEDSWPLWSPDGLHVLFGSTREGTRGLFRKAADGRGTVERLTTDNSPQIPYSWSPDGKYLVFQQTNPETGHDLYLMKVDNGQAPQPLIETRFNDVLAEISPDGRWMAYVSDETGQWELYVRPFPNVEDGKWQVSTETGVSPVWAPDSRKLFFRPLSLRLNAMMEVPLQTEPVFAAGIPSVLFDAEPYIFGWSRGYDLSPDGKRFLMIKRKQPTQFVIVLNWFEELKRLVPTEN
jgi:serine/threonine-protein kinase